MKQNNATELTALAETLAKTNKQRHEVIEDLFLTNDGTTFAVELPVYLTPDEAKRFKLDIKEPLTGHIDILRKSMISKRTDSSAIWAASA